MGWSVTTDGLGGLIPSSGRRISRRSTRQLLPELEREETNMESEQLLEEIRYLTFVEIISNCAYGK